MTMLLVIREVGRTLLDEGFHAFSSVFECKRRMERSLLRRESLLERRLKGSVHSFLADGHAHLRHRRDFLSEFYGFREELE